LLFPVLVQPPAPSIRRCCKGLGICLGNLACVCAALFLGPQIIVSVIALPIALALCVVTLPATLVIGIVQSCRKGDAGEMGIVLWALTWVADKALSRLLVGIH
jgi:hypothetical protein